MANDSKISTLDDGSETAVAPKPAAKRVVKASGLDAELSGKRVTVTVHASDLEGGHEAVSIGLNGYVYQIPRGVPVEVPEEVLEILKNAKTSTYTPQANNQLAERVTNRFAFSSN